MTAYIARIYPLIFAVKEKTADGQKTGNYQQQHSFKSVVNYSKKKSKINALWDSFQIE